MGVYMVAAVGASDLHNFSRELIQTATAPKSQHLHRCLTTHGSWMSSTAGTLDVLPFWGVLSLFLVGHSPDKGAHSGSRLGQTPLQKQPWYTYNNPAVRGIYPRSGD